ncbi:hypothetical protein E2C01_011489 [Portunus trituberculatus]|uniref:Uncharacterized protein n=1 Tax=Portunus trituberculatus TaxID=210409 RepID=A0A5B7DBB6_PORTR|nr:hypothetical protein [Portunus trituberculatus]
MTYDDIIEKYDVIRAADDIFTNRRRWDRGRACVVARSLWDISGNRRPIGHEYGGAASKTRVSIHLQTSKKVDVYLVPQEGQQEQLEEQPALAPAATPGGDERTAVCLKFPNRVFL